MRETQILRGLHKARTNRFADGVVLPQPPLKPVQPSPSGFVAQAFGLGDMPAFDAALKTDLATKKVTTPGMAPAAGQGADGMGGTSVESRMKRYGLRRGVAQLEGPGTATSDSIPAHLSKGEAVLPAKTVQAVGPHNIARLIHATNGKPPSDGLRAGGHFASGSIPMPELPDLDLSNVQPDANMPPKPAGLGANGLPKTYGVTPEAQAMRDAAAKRLGATPKPSVGATPGNPLGATAEGIDFSAARPQSAPTPQPSSALGRGWRGVKDAAASAYDAAKGLMPEAAAPRTLSQRLGDGLKASWAETGRLAGGKSFGPALDAAVGSGKGLLTKAGRAADIAGLLQAPTMGLEAAAKLTNTELPANATSSFDANHPVDSLKDGFMQPLKFIGAGLGQALATGKYSPLRLDQSTIDAANANNISAYDSDANSGWISKGGEFSLGAPGTETAASQPATAPAPRAAPAAQGTTLPSTGMGAGRGSVIPTPNPASPNPNIDNFTARAAASLRDGRDSMPWAAPGTVYKTIDPKTGATTYSGRDVSGDIGRNMVDGTGAPVAARGSAGGGVVGVGSNVVDGNAGRGLAAGSPAGSPAVSAALQAAASRGDWDAVKGFYQQNGGSFNGETAAKAPEVGDLGWKTARSNALTQRGQDMIYDSSMYGHRIQGLSAGLNRQIQLAQLQRELGKDAVANREAGSKFVDDYVSKDNLSNTVVDGKNVPDSGYRDFISRTLPTVLGGAPEDVYAHKPDAVKAALDDLGGQYALNKLAKEKYGNTFFNSKMQGKGLELADDAVSDSPALTDYKNGMPLYKIGFEKLFPSGTVRVKGQNGSTVALNIRDIQNADGSERMLNSLQNAFARKYGAHAQ